MLKRSGNTILGSKRQRLDRDGADAIGIAALTFLAEEPKRLTRFLSLSGLSPAELGAQAGDARLQAALLDHILADETLLLVFAAEKRIAPEDVGPARQILAGEAEDTP